MISLEVEPGCTLEQAQGAIEDLAQANQRRAPASQIAKALAVLTAVCARPTDFDDAKIVLWSERLKIVLQEYPDEIAMGALASWPKTENGKWWPTENELRTLCGGLLGFRRALQSELERAAFMAKPLPAPSAPPSDGFDDEPEGETATYVCTIWERMPEKAAAYLNGARFKGARIGTRYPLAELALERAQPGLIAKHGVRFVSPRAYREDGLVEWPE